MHLEHYLHRVGFAGKPIPDLDTLRRLHRGHAENIPYETLDVQFARPVSRNAAAAYDKIINRHRGGWCFEMNGLFGWALEDIGFRVRRLAGAVERDHRGDGVIGNHLVLLVDLDQTWVCDVGFGDGLIEPTLLAEGHFKNGPYQCRITDMGGGWKRYVNGEGGGAESFDFNEAIGDEALLEGQSRWLQTNHASPFVQNAVVQRWLNDEHLSLRGRVFARTGASGSARSVVDSAEDYVTTLRDYFALDLPEAAALWPKIVARHETVFAHED